MIYELDEEMEMPTPCIHCGKIFELNDGYGSEKWHKGTVICEKCFDEEALEIGRDEEVEELRLTISDAQHTIKDATLQLIQLGEIMPAAAEQNADKGRLLAEMYLVLQDVKGVMPFHDGDFTVSETKAMLGVDRCLKNYRAVNDIWNGEAHLANIVFGEKYGVDWEYLPNSMDIKANGNVFCVGQPLPASPENEKEG